MRTMKVETAAPIIFSIVLVISIVLNMLSPRVEIVDRDFVKANIGTPGVVVVDTRSEEVFDGKSPVPGIPGGHIDGAINFPLDDLNISAVVAALAKAGLTKSNTIILYCTDGHSSARFGEALVSQFGYDPLRVKSYRGGVVDWIQDPYNKLYPEDHETGWN